MAKKAKTPAPRKPRPLREAAHLLPLACFNDLGQVYIRPVMGLVHAKKIWAWLGRAVHWMEHQEAQSLARDKKASKKLVSARRKVKKQVSQRTGGVIIYGK